LAVVFAATLKAHFTAPAALPVVSNSTRHSAVADWPPAGLGRWVVIRTGRFFGTYFDITAVLICGEIESTALLRQPITMSKRCGRFGQ
jgi:hypothetical protein